MTESSRKRIEAYLNGFGSDFLDSPLGIIHELDRFDKHRELALTFVAFDMRLGRNAFDAYRAHKKHNPQETLAAFGLAMKNDVKITPQIAFKYLGTREIKPVVPLLNGVSVIVRELIGEFEVELV